MSAAIPWAVRKQFYEQASAQLANKHTLTDILQNFRDRLKRRNRVRSAEQVHQIWRRVRNGETLVRAMGASLTHLERSVLGSFEQIGNLPSGMALILEVRERTGDLRWKVLASLFPPIVYFITLYATLYVIGDTVVPEFLQTVSLEKWTGWAYVLYLMGHVATGWIGPCAMAAFAGTVGLVIWALPRWIGRGRTFFDRYSIGFAEYRELTGFTWLISYAALLRAMPDAEALSAQIKTANPWLASRLRPIQLALRNGRKLDIAMRMTGYGFPSIDLIEEISAYAGSPDFPERIEAVARQYAKSLEKRLLFKTAMMGTAFTFLMFFAVAVVQLGSNSLSSLLSTSFNAF